MAYMEGSGPIEDIIDLLTIQNGFYFSLGIDNRNLTSLYGQWPGQEEPIGVSAVGGGLKGSGIVAGSNRSTVEAQILSLHLDLKLLPENLGQNKVKRAVVFKT